VEAKYGWAPPGNTRLVLGHESLGRIIEPSALSGSLELCSSLARAQSGSSLPS
jgi:hypothetical protein